MSSEFSCSLCSQLTTNAKGGQDSQEGRLYFFCESCHPKWQYASDQIRRQRARSKKSGEPCTLSIMGWIQTVNAFDNRCAYCLKVPDELSLEHFVPLGMGVGTVKSNCVPSCHSCNTKKRSLHPSLVKLIPQEAIERVRDILASF